MARTRAEWIGRFGIGVLKNITGADLIIAISTKHQYAPKDYGLLAWAVIRFGAGVYASGIVAGTMYDIIHLLR